MDDPMSPDPTHLWTVDDAPRGAVVEIIDTNPDGRVLCPRAVKVNGVDVGLLADGGVIVEAGSAQQETRVTLILQPSKVVIS